MRTNVALIYVTLHFLARTLDAFDTNISVHGSGSMRSRSAPQQAVSEGVSASTRDVTLRHGRSRIKDARTGEVSQKASSLELGQSVAERIILGGRPAANDTVWKCNNICVRCRADQEEFMVQVKRAQSAKNYFGRFGKTLVKVATLGLAHFFFDKMPDECSSIAFKGEHKEENEGDLAKLKDLAKKDYRKVYKEEPYLLYQFLARGVCGGLANLVQFNFQNGCSESGGMHGAVGKDINPAWQH